MRASVVALLLVAALAAGGAGFYLWLRGLGSSSHDCSLTLYTGSGAASPAGWRYNVTHVVGAPPAVEHLRYELSRPTPDGPEVVEAGTFSEPGSLRFEDAPPADGLVRPGDAFVSANATSSALAIYDGPRLLGGTMRCL